MKTWRWICLTSALAVASACGDQANVPELPESTTEPGSTENVDRVASCDQAADGTPCGAAGEVKHCIFNACVLNSCGDGFPAGSEECDDGDESDGDGCDSVCRREVCGNRRKDLGEACDDGNTEAGDGCSALCELESEMGMDAGTDPDVAANHCPLPDSELVAHGITSITAVPSVAFENDLIQLSATALSDADVVWSYQSPPSNFPANDKRDGFSDVALPETLFQCPIIPTNTQGVRGDQVTQISIFLSKTGCPPVRRSTLVTCRPVIDAGSDEGATDAGLDAGHLADAGTQHGGDSSDAGLADASTGPGDEINAACLACMRSNCVTYSDIPLTGPCLDGATEGLGGSPLIQPEFSQRCTAAISCSAAAESNCFMDSIGPSQCYCGEISIAACSSSGPVANAPCKEEWERATLCDGITDATARNKCVGDTFQDLSTPAGYAFFLSNCAAEQCAQVCTN